MITYFNRVAVRDVNSGVSITRFSEQDRLHYNQPDEDSFIAFYMNLRFPGEAYTVISEDDIPKDQNGKWDKSQREHWSLKNKKVEVDQAKVSAKEAKEAEKDAIYAKMGVTKEEYEKIRGNNFKG